MANKIVKTWLVDGSKKAVLHVYLESDGVEGELNNCVLIDPQTDVLNNGFPSGPLPPDSDGLGLGKMSILQVWHGTSWFDMLLSFDGPTPLNVVVLARDADTYKDFRYFGGLTDRVGLDRTGKLLLTTVGFAPAGSIGSLVIEVMKD